MPCNGHNHPPTCECGWGGQWHGNYGGGKTSHDWEAEQIRHRDYFFGYWSRHHSDFLSYTNPNAKCPVCGERVFFYQSPYGGRVFFDELGPPWPKHPCTDNSSAAFGRPHCRDYPKPEPMFSTKPTTTPRWAQEGWEPVILVSLTRENDMTVLVVERMDNADRITLGINKSVMIDKQAPIHLQEHDEDLGVFDLSYLQLHGGGISPAQDTWYRNARKPAHVQHWRDAISGTASHQNIVASRLIFGNIDPEADAIELTDKKIDFDAADFWLQKSMKGGSAAAAENVATIQKKKLSAKFSGNFALEKADFKIDQA